MKIFKDIVTGDELLSDSYDVKLVDEVVFEADCAMIDLGGESFDIGANASAEGGDEEGVEDGVSKVNNIVHSFRLQSTAFDKKSYLSLLKSYLKKVKDHMRDNKGASEDEIKAFESKVQTYVKNTLLPNFKDFEFFTGESMDPDGTVVLLNYREDGVTPYVIVWKEGVTEMKV